jgi:hypothetical protein
VRFDVNKRALMLTVAAAALVGTPAYAATVTGCDSSNTTNYTDITTKVTVPLCTSLANKGASGNILIDTNGSVVVSGPSSSTATVVPAVTINSSNIVTNKGTIQFTGVTSAIGVQLNSANSSGAISGAFDNEGTVNLDGSGTSKIGILITTPTTPAGLTTTFTGVPLPNATTPVTRPTAIDLESGSVLEVQGDSSVGIQLGTATTTTTTTNLAGDILVGGSLTVSPTTVGELTGVGGTGVKLLGNMTGNFTVESGGTIEALGPGSQGVLLNGTLTGAFTNDGTIEAVGIAKPSATKANAESGSALWIENNISGGIYNGGPDIASTTARAVIGSSGLAASPTIFISPLSGATSSLVIGAATDPDGVTGDSGFGLLNRGSILASPANSDTSATAIRLAGANSIANVLLAGGILDAGSISATANTTTASQSTPIDVTAIIVDDYAVVPKIVTSNESGGGTITAAVGGTGESVATAIAVNSSGSVTEIDNAGSILASATSTDNTIVILQAYAIRDLAGTITTINNTGTIEAIATPLISGGLHDVTFTNNGTVTGDVLFGAHNDTFKVIGLTATTPASMTGNINFGGNAPGGNDTLTIGGNDAADSVTGKIQEQAGGTVAVTIYQGASLFLENNGDLTGQTDFSNASTLSANLPVSNLSVQNDATLGLTLSQAFNSQSSTFLHEAIIESQTAGGLIDLQTGAKMQVSFGSFISTSTPSSPAQFILLEAPNLTIANEAQIASEIAGPTTIPFLFTGSVCTYHVASSPNPCTGTNPLSTSTDGALVLDLAPKMVGNLPGQLDFTGYAAKMFPLANAALANDNALGAAVIAAGINIPNTVVGNAVGNALYQKIYSAFAPDVTGAVRAEAISLTDQATGPVGAHQRALRMYADQDGETTLWGQEFAQQLQVGNQLAAAGYVDTGFGLALGMDAGDPADGRYGAAFTFFSGSANEKAPRDSKTRSEWLMLTGYTDWRGKGFFFDSQLTVGYANLEGKRYFNFGNVFRVADGKRAAALLAGGATAGVAMTTGGTVLMPQLSVDALTMREEAYSESNGGATTSRANDGFDLHVHQDYAQSLRGFAGVDLRQDLNLGSFFLQPELRVGYRYDFVNGTQKLKAEFVSVPSDTFTITGPDPARGNLVAGGSVATTTGAWSIGINYDYVKGMGMPLAKETISQSGTLTLVGRI